MGPRSRAAVKRGGWLFGAVIWLAGCVSPVRSALTAQERAIAEAARPILEMNPDAVWTDCYNRLVEIGPASVKYLVEDPALDSPVAPDDLRVLLRVSLVRVLVHPAARPHLSANCLETSLDLLHFDLKADGRPIGTPLLAERNMPANWHELYPEDFDGGVAGRIDAEADRAEIRRWWRERRGEADGLALDRPLRPRAESLWRVLSRRYADRWTYQPQARAARCAAPPADPVMISTATCDYNLVRAACVWLGSREEASLRDRLIELVGSPSPVVSHNAVFALRYAGDPRIREVLDRYKDVMEREAMPVPVGAEFSSARGGW